METLYGTLDPEQFKKYKKKLHSKIHWLLLYKDPATKEKFASVDFGKYFESLMRELNGLNDILLNPPYMVEILSILQAAYNETLEPDFNYELYRKFILDAHSALDKMTFKEEG